MSFSKAASSLTSRHSWSSVYRLSPSNQEDDFITSPLLFFRSWQKMNKQSDIMLFLLEFPHTGIIFCDGRNQPTLVHGIRKQESSNFFQGFIGNRINSSPVEFEILTDLFSTRKLGPPITVDSDSDDSITPHRKSGDSIATDASKEASGTNTPTGITPNSFFLIHPFILPFLLDLPQPLSSPEMKITFANIEHQAHLSFPEDNTIDNVKTALKHTSTWIDRCRQNHFHATNFFQLQDEDIIEEMLSERIPKAFWSSISATPLKHPEIELSQTETGLRPSQPDILAFSDKHPQTHTQTTRPFRSTPETPHYNTNQSAQNNVLLNPASAVDTHNANPTSTMVGPTHTSIQPNIHNNVGTSHRANHQNTENQPNPQTNTALPVPVFPTYTDSEKINLLLQNSITAQQTQLTAQQTQLAVQQSETHLHATVAQLVKRQSTEPSKRTLFENLPPNIQLAIRRGSAHDKNIEPEEPTTSFTDLIAAGSKAKATSFLISSLKDSAVRGECQQGHISRLLYNGPFWPTPVYAQGLTIFSINADPKYSPEIEKHELKTSMKANHDNHLDEEDVEFLAKQDTFFPKNFNEMEIQLSTFITLLEIYFGPASIITKSFQRALHHLTRNYDDYRVQADNNIFCTRVLYCYDIGLQKHLHRLKDKSTPFDEISYYFIEENFRQIQDDIINLRLSITIPSQMLDCRNKQIQQTFPNTKKRRRNDPDTQDYKNNDDSPPRNKNDPLQQQKNSPDKIVNSRPNTKWTIPPSLKFKDCFYKNNKFLEPPSHDGKPFCLLFFCVNSCKRGKHCNLSHSDPRDVAQESLFDKFCEKAYSS
jgi:hypothetical protein